MTASLLRRPLLAVAVLALAIGHCTGVAAAYTFTTGTGTASAAVGTLAAPTLTATPGAAAVALSWSTVTPPGSGTGPVTYYVTRDGGAPAGNCPGVASPTAVTSCTDTEVAIGTHNYTVTARWRTWKATSAAVPAQVTSGAATKLVLTAASAAPAAGATDNLTITVKDAANVTVTSYAGSHGLVFSGAASSPAGNAPTVSNSSGTAVAFGSTTALNFTAGVATVSGAANGVMTVYKAGAATIIATDGSISSAPGFPINVAAGPAGELSLAAASSTPTAGTTDNLTVTALDAWGNVATSYTGSNNLVFSGAAASPAGNAPTVRNRSGTAVAFGSATALNFTAGVATVSGTSNGAMVIYGAGAATINATAGSISSSPGLAVDVGQAAASSLAYTDVVVSAGTLTSPCLFTCAVTGLGNSGTFAANVSVTDAYGNTVDNLGAGHSVGVTANGGATITNPNLTIASTGPADSTQRFTFTSKANGNFNSKITAKTSAGTSYTNAVATAKR